MQYTLLRTVLCGTVLAAHPLRYIVEAVYILVAIHPGGTFFVPLSSRCSPLWYIVGGTSCAVNLWGISSLWLFWHVLCSRFFLGQSVAIHPWWHSRCSTSLGQHILVVIHRGGTIFAIRSSQYSPLRYIVSGTFFAVHLRCNTSFRRYIQCVQGNLLQYTQWCRLWRGWTCVQSFFWLHCGCGNIRTIGCIIGVLGQSTQRRRIHHLSWVPASQ